MNSYEKQDGIILIIYSQVSEWRFEVKLSEKNQHLFNLVLSELEEKGNLAREKKAIQHGSTTVYEHSVGVAGASLMLAEIFHIKVNEKALVRGALLHDYFLYDWHEKDDAHKWHGFHHANTAWKNAMRDLPDLNEVEQDMIRCHMFPLNVVPPKYKDICFHLQ